MKWFLIAACALLVASLAAQQQPTAAEMAFIYELNRARSNPQNYDTENSLGGILNGVAAQPPLALNLNLVQSARFHSAEMGANGYFGHPFVSGVGSGVLSRPLPVLSEPGVQMGVGPDGSGRRGLCAFPVRFPCAHK